MSFNHFNRRLHLYLALALLPWFLVYGVSSLAIQHPDLFSAGEPDAPPWEQVGERAYTLDIPDDPDWRQVGARVLEDEGVEGLFRVDHRDPDRIRVFRFSFWSQTRYTYDVASQTLTTERQGRNLRTFLVWMHIRSGFGQESILNDLWALIVDIVNVGFILWIATGLYMWWLLPAQRRWGFVALGGGILTFTWFLISL